MSTLGKSHELKLFYILLIMVSNVLWGVCYAQLLQSCLTLCDLVDSSPLYPWDSPGKNAGVDCHAFLHGILLTQGSNLDIVRLLHCRWILYC